MLKLQNKVEIIVPKADNEGKEVKSPIINQCIENITQICGGCTVADVRGQWYSDDEQRIMQDNNANYEWYYDKDMQDLNAQQGLLRNLSVIARRLIESYGQEAISIKVNSTLYIIDEDDLEFLTYDLFEIIFK